VTGIESNIVIGRRKGRPSRSSHVTGVREGNAGTTGAREPGILPGGRRSTGINARRREPIDPRMPKLSPP
jgi:hypothetical protein